MHSPASADTTTAPDRAAGTKLIQLTAGLGIFYLALGAGRLFIQAFPRDALLASLAAASGVLLVGTAYSLYSRNRAAAPLPKGWVRTLGLCAASLVLLNSLVLVMRLRPLEAALHLFLAVLAAALVLQPPRWLAVFVVLGNAAWLAAAAITGPLEGWLPAALWLVPASLFSFLIHHSQKRMAGQIEVQRGQIEQSRAELTVVLKNTEEAQRSLATSTAIGQRITSILDLDDLLDQVAALIKDRFLCSYVGVFLLDESGEYLIARGGNGSAGRSLAEAGFRYRMGEGLPGWTAAKRRPARVDELSLDSRCIQLEAAPPARSEVTLPLEVGATLLGVLDMQNENPAAFQEDDVPFLQLLADQVAIAIHNASLYAKLTRLNQDLEKIVEERTEELQQAYDQLEQLDRSKSDFISIASHELRTPLTVLSGYTQMLLDDPTIQSNTLLHQISSGMYGGIVRLHEIVNSMLDTAKIDSRALELHPSPVMISTLIERVCSGLEAGIQDRKQNLSIGNLRDLPAIEGDPEALRKVFYHLVVNAIKYTPDGGTIRIDGRCLGDPELSERDSAVELVVSDTGIGIAPELQEIIFTKFFQTGEGALHSSGKTKFKGGGPGLGLTIARGIINAHGGRIWVESSGYDEQNFPGSRFHIVLPLRQS